MTVPATLTGLAIGDALGAPFETHHFSSKAFDSWNGGFVDSVGLNSLQPGLRAGQYTDDTKMASALAWSLIEQGTYNPVRVAYEYLAWYSSGDHRGMGKATRTALERLLGEHSWNSSGVLDAQGNGTAMRIAPLGLYYRKNLRTLCDMARIDATITHRSEEAQEGSVAVAVAVGLLVQQMVTKPYLISAVLPWLRSQGSTLTLVESRLLELEAFLREPRDLKAVMAWSIEHGTGARVSETVPAAFLCFLSTSSFKEAVELAVRLGGDTDTTASITGAIAGTYYGTEAVQPYLARLEDAEKFKEWDHRLWLEAPDIAEIP